MSSVSKNVLIAIVAILAVVLILQGSSLITGFAPGLAETVPTLYNVTNSAPWVTRMYFGNAAMPTLACCANSTDNLIVNATVYDANGRMNVTTVTATVYNANYSSATCAQDHVLCYRNVSCSNTSFDLTTMNVSCNLQKMTHYMRNGTWYINITASDGVTTTSNTTPTDNLGAAVGLGNAEDLSVLKCLDANDTVDFGSGTAGVMVHATNNVSNCGNWLMDVQVNGSTMLCGGGTSILAGNISVGVTNAATDVPNLGAGLSTLTGLNGIVGTDAKVKPWNVTYWNLSVPTGVQGNCQGNATFTWIEG